jgi:hypothetical protein
MARPQVADGGNTLQVWRVAANILNKLFTIVFNEPRTWTDSLDKRPKHNEELHNLYSSPSITRMIKSRRIRWAGHGARMGRGGMHIGYW